MSSWRPHIPLQPNPGDKVECYQHWPFLAKLRFTYRNDGWHLLIIILNGPSKPEWREDGKVWLDSFELKQWVASTDVDVFPTLAIAATEAIEDLLKRVADHQFQIIEELGKLMPLHLVAEPEDP